eukprot:938669-Pyramimonas_sp.AAC.1
MQDPAGEVSESCKQLIGVTEQYLCDLAGLDIGKYGGRGDGPELSWTKACPPSAPRIPKVSNASRWLKGAALAAADAVSSDPIRQACGHRALDRRQRGARGDLWCKVVALLCRAREYMCPVGDMRLAA